MTATIGFILLTHSKPHQIHRLVDRLNRMFDNPAIACHHDFSQTPLAIEAFPKNVSFVQPHLKTEWGEFSLVESTIRALELLYQTANPDWVINLSGADYPIKTADQILSDLETGEVDAHLHYEFIDPPNFAIQWQEEMWKRYYTRWILTPRFLVERFGWRRKFRLKPMVLFKPFLPFSSELRCYAGWQWFCVNRRAANYILEFHHTRPELANHYRHVRFADESYFQTILLNAPQIKINRNNWRYIDWSRGGEHPKQLELADLPQLLESSAHFARKFDPDFDSQILDALDEIVLPSIVPEVL